MRWAVLTLALMLVVAEPASAAVPVRDCGSRGEGQRPIRRLVDRGDLQIGPVAFVGLARLADPSRFGGVGESRNGRVLLKTPLKVRAGRVVTVRVSSADRSVAGLTFVHGAPLATGQPAVKFVACRKGERAFSYDGVVGAVTGFPGGFSLAGPACVHMSVRVRGYRTVYARTVSFGMGPVAGNCDRI